MINRIKGSNANLICVCAFLAVIAILLNVIYMPVFRNSYSSIQQHLPNETISFTAAGAWGCTPKTQNTVDNMLRRNPDLILGLGDYSYGETEDCWLNMAKPILPKMKIALGNNDVYSVDKLRDLALTFNVTSPWYSFDYDNVHFIALATDHPRSTKNLLEYGGEQYDWLENDLAATVANNLSDWIIVFFHQTAYGSKAETHEPLMELSLFFHPLFMKYGVDLVLQGHSLFYDRTFPVIRLGNTTLPVVTSTNKSSYNNPEGQVFANVGTGGHSISNYLDKPTYVAAQGKSYGFLEVNIDNARFLNATFFANGGRAADNFVISKTR
jgi:predicted phosphodiesterase